MTLTNNIGKKLDDFFTEKGFSNYKVAQITGISEPSIGRYRKGQSKPNSTKLGVLLNCFPELQGYLTGEGQMLKEEEQPLQIQKIHNPPYREAISEDTIPLYDIDASANLKTLFDTKHQNILDTLRIPNLPKCDGAVYVRGDSMYPLLKSGDIVAYKQIPVEALVPGEMYLIDFNIEDEYYLAVKYIKRSEIKDHVKLISYNTHHEPMDIHLSCINALAIIKASVRLNTMM